MKKVALVTGAGRGIGRAIALRLAKDGFAVAVNDLAQTDADQVTAELSETCHALGIAADVSKAEQVQQMIAKVVAEFGRLDVMVNNAGIAHVGPLLELTEAELDKIFAVNVKSTLWCAQAAAKQMIQQGGGKIINAGSLAAHAGFPLMGAYCTTKFSVKALTQVLAKELAAYGITVNAYCPGIVGTGMWDLIDEKMSQITGQPIGATVEKAKEMIALGRIETPEDVASFVSYLASDDANYMTGQTVLIDGGVLMN